MAGEPVELGDNQRVARADGGQRLIDAAGQGLGWISLSGAPLARTTPAEGL